MSLASRSSYLMELHVILLHDIHHNDASASRSSKNAVNQNSLVWCFFFYEIIALFKELLDVASYIVTNLDFFVFNT